MSDVEYSFLEHCTGRQLNQLLELAASGAKSARDWVLEVGDWESMQALLASMCTGSEPSADGLLRATCSADTPLELLVSAKDIAKRFAAGAQDSAQNAAATLLYHLAIAAALAQFGRNISSNEATERRGLYEDLAAELPDDALAAVFEKAVARLRALPPNREIRHP